MTSRKMDILKQNEDVCFEVDLDHELVERETACLCGMKFRSVIGFGKASLVEDAAEKAEARDIIMEHYFGPGDHDYPPEMLDITAIIKVKLETLTAMVHGYEEA
jgi:uncharacterized protein